jgi:cytochrome c oxidase subunit 2
MQFAVRVVSQKEYDKWLKDQKPIVTEDMKKEYQLAMKDNLSTDNKKIALNN